MNMIKKNFVHLLCALSLSAGFSLVEGTEVNAQTSLVKQAGSVTDKQPLLLQADEVTYDKRGNRVIARGNVEIYYNNYTLLADQIIYDQRANTLSANGNVRMKHPDGSVTNASTITIRDDLKEGFIDSLKIVTKDNARIAAARGRRVDENTTIFEKGVYTPCKTCKDRKAPLWRIKASKIIHRKDEGNIYYEGASLELFGVPIIYVPYFSHPDPTVKRRSGFLFPKVEQSSELGFTAELPYFYSLAPNRDFTFNPMFTTKQGVVWKGEYRHRTKNGKLSISGGIINEDDPSYDGYDNRLRGTVETKGSFKLGTWWQWGWDITAESDDTFRRVYGFDEKIVTNRVSKIYAIGKSERNWFEANLYHFGALTSLDTSNAEAFVHPSIDYNYIFSNPVLGGELSFDTNVLGLSRNDGTDTNRIVTQLKWRKTLIDSLGQVYEPKFLVRGDLRQYSNTAGSEDINPDDSSFTASGQALGAFTYKFPLVARTKRATHIITPTAQIIGRPDIGDQDHLPNEDAKSLVFDDTLLFDVDKFSGYDRQETGVRSNVGLQYTMQLNSGGYVKAVVGQSFHIAGDNAYQRGTGLGTDRSDYVTGLYIEPNSNLTFISQARFDEENYSMKRADVYMRANYGPFAGTVNYANIDASLDEQNLGIPEDRQEVAAAGSLQVSNYWSLFGAVRYNITDNQIIEDSLGLKYADECFVLAVSYNESYIQDGDIEEEQKVMVRFELKQLGGTSFQTNISDDLFAGTESHTN